MKPSFHTITINTRCIILNCSGIITDGGRSRGKSCDDGDNLVVQRRDQSNGGSLSSRILPMMSSPLLLLERPSIIIRHRSNNASSVNCEMMQTAFLNPLCHHLRGSNRGISTNITDSTNTDTMTPEKQDIVTIARTTKYSSKCAQQRLNDDENKDVKNHVSDDTQSTTKTHNDEHDDDDEWKVNQRTWRQKNSGRPLGRTLRRSSRQHQPIKTNLLQIDRRMDDNSAKIMVGVQRDVGGIQR